MKKKLGTTPSLRELVLRRLSKSVAAMALVAATAGCGVQIRQLNSETLEKARLAATMGDLFYTASDPASPGNQLVALVQGYATVDATSVNLYGDSACLSIIGGGGLVDFESVGVPVNVDPNATTAIYGRALHSDGSPASPCRLLVNYLHDSVAPSVVLTTPANGSSINASTSGSVTFSGSCSEDGRIVQISGSATGSAMCTGGAFSFPMNLMSVADGPLNFTATQTDAAQNTGSSTTATVTKDVTAPTLAISAPVANSYASVANVSAFAFSGTCGANGRPVVLTGATTGSVNCSSNAWSFTLDLSAVAQGAFSLTVNHSDAAGNAAPSVTRSFIKDTVVPTVAITAPAAGSSINSGNAASFTLSGTCSETGRSIAITGSVATTTSCSGTTWTVTLNLASLADGAVSFTANHEDAAGNDATASTRAFVKDTGTPTVAITSPAAGSFINGSNVGSFAVSGTCSENGRSVVLTGDATDTVVCTAGAWTSNLNFTAAAQGTATVYANHSDAAGNDAVEASRAFVKDTVVPTVAISAPAAGTAMTAATSASFSVSGTCSETGRNVVITGDAAATVSCLAGTWNAALDFSAAADGAVSIAVNHSDAAGNAAAQDTRSFTKDAAVPTVAITAPAAASSINASNVSSFTVSGTCSENARNVVLSGSASATVACAAGAWTANLDFSAAGQGAVTVNANHSDAVGNAATQDSRSFNKDTVIPTVAYTSPAAGSAVNSVNMGSYTVTGTCSENTRNVVLSGSASTTVACSAGTWTANLDFTSAADGAVTVNANHMDAAGNAAVQASISFTKTSAPGGTDTLAINGGAGYTTTTAVTLTLHSDNYTTDMYVTNVAGCASGGAWQAYATSRAWTLGQTNGTATVYVQYRDGVGNVTACISDTIIHDNTLPTVAVTAPAANSPINAASVSAFTVSGTCSENTRNVVISGAASATVACAAGAWTASLDFSAAGQGAVTVNVDHTDAAGNAAVQASRSFVKDTVLPTVAVSTPAASSIIPALSVASYTVTGTCSENTQNVVISGSASSTVACSAGAWTANLDFSAAADGTVTINVNHSDAAGNPATQASRSFVKDTTAPTVAISNPAANSSINAANVASYAVDGTCSENTRNVVVSGAASGTVACTGGLWSLNLDFSAAAQGAVTINVNHSDAAGNLATQASRAFVKDTVLPTIAFTAPSAGAHITSLNVTAFTVSGTCSENTRTVTIGDGTTSDSVACSTGSFTKNVNFSGSADGARTITITHTDAAGNSNSATVAVTKDVAVPTVAITAPAVNTYINAAAVAAFTVSGTCSENGRSVALSGPATGSETCTTGAWSSVLDFTGAAEGNVTLNANHSDTAGNPATQGTRVFIKDTVAPTLAITAPTAGAYIHSGNVTAFTVSGTCSENTRTVTIGDGTTSDSATCTGGNYTKNVNFSGSAEGARTITVSMSDAAGNSSNTTVAVTKKTVLPTVAITSPAANSYINIANVSSVTVSGTCSENGRNVVLSGAASGTATCATGAWTINLNFTSAAQGNITLLADHSDVPGNGATQASRVYIKDTVAPTVSLSSHDGGEIIYVGDVETVSFTAADTGGTGIPANSVAVAYSTTNGAPWTNATTTGNSPSYAWTVPAAPTTNGLVRITATDAAGNSTTDTSAAVFTIRHPPLLAWDPDGREHGSIPVGQDSTVFSFTLTNSGLGIAYCDGPVTFTGSPAQFEVVNGCTGMDMAPGASCTVTVNAKPLSTGLHTMTLRKNCVRTGAVDATVSVTGITPAGTFVWRQPEAVFGAIRTGGQTLDREFFFLNYGYATGSCSAPTITGTNATDFTLTDLDCSTNNLEANRHCTVKVRANPAASGNKTATLSRVCNGVTTTRTITTSDGGASTPSTMATSGGDTVNCAILADQTVKCWGSENDDGELGNNSTSLPTGPVFVVGTSGTGKLGGVTQVAVGDDFACALSGGSVYCWGEGDYGALGDGVTATSSVTDPDTGVVTTTTYSVSSSKPVQVRTDAATVLTGVNEIAAGGNFACARIGTRVKCWGNQDKGRLGNGQTSGESLYAVDVSTLDGSDPLIQAAQITVGRSHACALLTDGTAKCWGEGLYGRLGNGSSSAPVATPTTVLSAAATPLTQILEITAGYLSTCARIDDVNKTLRCWGQGDNGQLGNGSTTDRYYASHTVTGLTNVTRVAMSRFTQFSCALSDGGSLSCWGENEGQLHDSSYLDKNSPVVNSDFAVGSVASMNAAGNSVCALKTDSTVYCFGAHYDGALGTRPTGSSGVPREFAGIAGATQVVYGVDHGCALFPGSVVKCWGRNNFNNVGNNSGTRVLNPVTITIPGSPALSKIVTGERSTCVVSTAGEVYCWGNNDSGMSGVGYAGGSIGSPTQIPPANLSTVEDLAVGSNHVCARLANKTVKCWGDNTYGQIGNGVANSTDVVIPTTVLASTGPNVTLTNVEEVTAGHDYSCARLTAGNILCWGSNSNSRLGINTTGNRSLPTPVKTLVGGSYVDLKAIRIRTGLDHSCAVLSNNRVKCWGGNFSSKLGDGTTTNRSSAIYVPNVYGAKDLQLGDTSSCAFLGRKDFHCWGRDGESQSGAGTFYYFIAPTKITFPGAITGLANTSTSAGTNQACVIGDASKVFCWGSESRLVGIDPFVLYRVNDL